jgi:hypothetical protein
MKRLVLFLIALLLLGNSNIVFADFRVNGDTEDFEGTFPPPGWTVTIYNDYGSNYGGWAQGTGYGSGAGFSGNQAQSIYGDYMLDTSLISPDFSTVGFSEVNIEFSGYFYFYSGYGNICDLQYSTDFGSNWNTLKTWGDYGSPALEKINLPAEALGQANVRIRWRRYTSSYPYYYAVIDNVRLTAPTKPEAIPTLSEWGMIILTVFLGTGSAYYLRRRRLAV